MELSFKNLGGLARPFDIRDLHLGSVTPPGTTPDHPTVYMQDNAWAATIYMQNQQPACGAHSGSFLKALLDSYESKPRIYTPRFTWMDIKSFDGVPLDSGTDMRSIFKSLAATGALDFDLLGNDSTLSEKAYADKSLITQAMKDNAQPHIINTYAFEDNPSFEELKRLIYLNKGVIIRIEVGNEWWTAVNGKSSWAEKDILPLRAPTSVVSGHFICCHSYDENYIYFANSWSTDWGRKGHGYFGADHMKYVTEAGTAVDAPDASIIALVQRRSTLQNLLNLLLHRK